MPNSQEIQTMKSRPSISSKLKRCKDNMGLKSWEVGMRL